MDEIRKAIMYENSAYLITATGNVFRVWIDGEEPSIEKLIYMDAKAITTWEERFPKPTNLF